MIDRRHAIRLSLAGLPAAWLVRSSTARAEQAFARFIPFLADLDGWQGKKPDGMSMEMPGNSMITATREYHRDAARLPPASSSALPPRGHWPQPRPE